MATALRAPSSESPDALQITTIRRRERRVGVPRLIMTPARIRELPIDPRAAFLLSHIDGHSSLETLVDVTGFDQGEVLSMLALLARLGAIAAG